MMARITCSTMTIVKPALRQLFDQRDRLIDLGRVESCHHFVEQQQSGLRRQRPRHFQAPLIDRRQILRRASAPLRRQADELDGLAGLLARDIGLRCRAGTHRS